jgi:hypothetical protein
MSPFSANYSSLDEVWGDGFAGATTKKSKKSGGGSTGSRKWPKDPLCELYELGSSPSKAYTENDIMEYVNSAGGGADNYSKVDFVQSPMPESREPLEIREPMESVREPGESMESAREPSESAREPIEPVHAPRQAQESDDEEEYAKAAAPPPPPPAQNQDDVMDFMGYIDKKMAEEKAKRPTNPLMPLADVSLFVISGIILIFMMEQFVKVGMSLKNF